MDGYWQAVMGNPEANGAWLLWGPEKNGKTWFAVKLADYLSTFMRVLYVSAEEGIGKAFVDTCRRAALNPGNRNLNFEEYVSIQELDALLSRRRSPQCVVLDNMTIYADELKNGTLRRMLNKYPQKLFVFVAHEERNEPYTATAKLVRKLAKVIVYVRGLMCTVSGRVPGGNLMIDQDRADLYHTTVGQPTQPINNN
jgi:hypothetical protein